MIWGCVQADCRHDRRANPPENLRLDFVSERPISAQKCERPPPSEHSRRHGLLAWRLNRSRARATVDLRLRPRTLRRRRQLEPRRGGAFAILRILDDRGNDPLRRRGTESVLQPCERADATIVGAIAKIARRQNAYADVVRRADRRQGYRKQLARTVGGDLFRKAFEQPSVSARAPRTARTPPSAQSFQLGDCLRGCAGRRRAARLTELRALNREQDEGSLGRTRLHEQGGILSPGRRPREHALGEAAIARRLDIRPGFRASLSNCSALKGARGFSTSATLASVLLPRTIVQTNSSSRSSRRATALASPRSSASARSFSRGRPFRARGRTARRRRPGPRSRPAGTAAHVRAKRVSWRRPAALVVRSGEAGGEVRPNSRVAPRRATCR